MNKLVQEDINRVCEYIGIDYNQIRGKTFLVTGLTGTIGSFFVLCLLELNRKYNLKIKVVGCARNRKKVEKIFIEELSRNKKDIEVIYSDILKPLNYKGKIDYIVHTANNTSSGSFVETIPSLFDIRWT